MSAAAPVPDSFAEKAYEHLKNLTVSFGFKPGERLNEIELAREIGVSRTPLREALNRLNTEGYLKFVAGKGYFCRNLDPKEIYDLYELRKVIEVGAVAGGMKHARAEHFDELEAIQNSINQAAASRDTQRHIELDEAFHERLVGLAGNSEMLRVLRNVNGRIRFVRAIASDYVTDHAKKNREHRMIINLLRQGEMKECAEVLDRHISLRLDQITAAIREGIAMIFLPPSAAERDLADAANREKRRSVGRKP